MSEAHRTSKMRVACATTSHDVEEGECPWCTIERLTRESEAWDKASLVAIIADRDRLTVERDQLLTAIGEHVTVRSDQYAQIQRLTRERDQALARMTRYGLALERWSSDGRLQTFEDRQRFRTEVRALSEEPGFPSETPARRSLQQQVMSFISAGVNTGLWNRDIAYDLVRQMLNARWNEASPRGKPCTCDNALGSSCACRVDAGERLGDLWYCRKRAESAEKASERWMCICCGTENDGTRCISCGCTACRTLPQNGEDDS